VIIYVAVTAAAAVVGSVLPAVHPFKVAAFKCRILMI
jgi:hypothetical protein